MRDASQGKFCLQTDHHEYGKVIGEEEGQLV